MLRKYRRLLIPVGAGILYLSLMVIFNNLLRAPLMVSFATNISLVISAALFVNFVPGAVERPRRVIAHRSVPAFVFPIAALPLAFLGQLIVQSVAVYFPADRVSSVVLNNPSDVYSYFLQAIFLAPLAEEILFRGALYGTIRNVISPFASAVCSSVLFGALHGSFFSAVLMSLVGFYFVIVFECTDNLTFAILTHMAYNTGILVAMFLLRGWIVSPLFICMLFGIVCMCLLTVWHKYAVYVTCIYIHNCPDMETAHLVRC